MSKNPVKALSGLVIVTGASSGIGLELARCAAADGCELILVALDDLAPAAAAAQKAGAAAVETLVADLSTRDGIEAVLGRVGERPVAALFANAGSGHGGAFLDQPWSTIARTINTNVTGTVALVHAIGRRMRAAGAGRILVTGSIAGNMPGPFDLTYNSTKAFLNDFCVGLAEELKDSPVVVSCLLPGATDTPFFAKAGMEDTLVARGPKADPARVARDGYSALLAGETRRVSGLVNTMEYLFADLLPGELVAKLHRAMAGPNPLASAAPADKAAHAG